MIILIYLIVIAIILSIQYVVAKKFEAIAFQKGYDESIHSCAMCFWLGIVGYLYVIALPNLNISSINNNSEDIKHITQSDSENVEKTDKTKVTNYNRYECHKIVITNKNGSGHCFMCRESNDFLKICKVKNSVGTRDIAICDSCIRRFQDNCLN